MSREKARAHRPALTGHIEARIKELRLTYREVAEAAGYSESWIRYARKDYDREITEEFASQLDKALKWTEGSTLAILAGGEPTPITATAERLDRPRDPAPQAPARAAESGQLDLVGFSPHVPGSILEIIERWQSELTARQLAQLTFDLVRVRDSGYREGWSAGRGPGSATSTAPDYPPAPPPAGG